MEKWERGIDFTAAKEIMDDDNKIEDYHSHTISIYIYIYIYIGLIKFDLIYEHDKNPTRFLWVWIEYNRVWIIFVLTRLTRLINGSYSC